MARRVNHNFCGLKLVHNGNLISRTKGGEDLALILASLISILPLSPISI